MRTDEEGRLLTIVTEHCGSIGDISQFKALFLSPLRQIIPNDMAAFGVCDLVVGNIAFVVNIDFPLSYVSRVIDRNRSLQSPVARMWRESGKPQVIDVENADSLAEGWVRAAREYNIRGIVAHGQIDLSGRFASYFTLARRATTISVREATFFAALVPHLHAALARVMPIKRELESNVPDGTTSFAGVALKRKGEILSGRETEILHWISIGKTNGEIGTILGISEFTVKNHVQNILGKLSVRNRLQAVHRAVSLGVIVRPEGVPSSYSVHENIAVP